MSFKKYDLISLNLNLGRSIECLIVEVSRSGCYILDISSVIKGEKRVKALCKLFMPTERLNAASTLNKNLLFYALDNENFYIQNAIKSYSYNESKNSR